MTLAAALSDVEFEFIDGVDGAAIPEKALPHTLEHDRLPDPAIGAWRGHLNAIQEQVHLLPISLSFTLLTDFLESCGGT